MTRVLMFSGIRQSSTSFQKFSKKCAVFSFLFFFCQLEIGEIKKTLVSGFLNREMGHTAKGGGGSGETGRKKGEIAL